MKFPSVNDVAQRLRQINEEVDYECDVRLCVWQNTKWVVRYGLSDYDQEHSDYCGAGSVPGGRRRFPSEELAKELLDQVKDQRAEHEG